MYNSLISIIIPIYNVEPYLSQCIESIINQTYDNLEIICIDDKSPDGCREILNHYSENDPRIIIIEHKYNKGISEARNSGLISANGEYIMFVDADDWLDTNTCEITLRKSIEFKADVVMWPYISEYGSKSNKKLIFKDKFIYFSIKDFENRVYRRLFGLIKEELRNPEYSESMVTVWAKLYRRSLIVDSSARFVDTKIIGTSEDMLFNIETLKTSRTAIYTNECFYHYRKYNNNAYTAKYKPVLPQQWNKLYSILQDYINRYNLSEEYVDALRNRISLSIIGLGFNEINSDNNIIKKIKNIKNVITNPRYLDSIKRFDFKYLPIHWKVLLYFSKKKYSSGLYIILKIAKIIRRII